MDSHTTNRISTEDLRAAFKEVTTSFDQFLCDLDTFIRQEEEVIARYVAEFCCDNTETSKQIAKEKKHDES